MTLRRHTPDDLGMALHLLADDEERRPDAAIAQDIEQERGPDGIRSVVECKADRPSTTWAMGEEQAPR